MGVQDNSPFAPQQAVEKTCTVGYANLLGIPGALNDCGSSHTFSWSMKVMSLSKDCLRIEVMSQSFCGCSSPWRVMPALEPIAHGENTS
jgi:hypothetical protein